MTEKAVGLLGATSLIGDCLLPLLAKEGWPVKVISRKGAGTDDGNLIWRKAENQGVCASQTNGLKQIPYWINLTPIWVLPEYFSLLEDYGVRRVVALSSTSRFSKDDSSDPEEQAVARRLAEAEALVQEWAAVRGVEWVILRPTLIYGLGRDKNVAEIGRFIRSFGFFPLLGKAAGLRQPVNAQDLAGACLTAMQVPCAANRAYNLSGGETLSYRDMVARIFAALGRPLRLLPLPLPAFRLAVTLMRRLPRYRHWSVAMAERMNRDLVFDHSEAAQDLSFKPRAFVLSAGDLEI